MLPVDTVSIDAVFDQYFGSRPPFQGESKKSEFPDAFAVRAVLQWCEQENDRIYVVSNDKGIQDCCEGVQPLIPLQTLDEFLDLAARQREELYAFANRIFVQLKNEILDNFKEEFQSIFFYIDEADGDVSDAEVEEIDIIEELTISVEPNAALFEITADVKFTANYSYATYIVEDVIVSRDEGVLERTIEVHAEVGLLYDQIDPEATQLEFVSIRENHIKINLELEPSDLK